MDPYIISDEKYSEDELKLRRLGLREANIGDFETTSGSIPISD